MCFDVNLDQYSQSSTDSGWLNLHKWTCLIWMACFKITTYIQINLPWLRNWKISFICNILYDNTFYFRKVWHGILIFQDWTSQLMEIVSEIFHKIVCIWFLNMQYMYMVIYVINCSKWYLIVNYFCAVDLKLVSTVYKFIYKQIKFGWWQ